MITLLSAARRLVAVAFALLLVCQAGAAVAAPARNEIIWDKWGVPHIYATSREKARTSSKPQERRSGTSTW